MIGRLDRVTEDNRQAEPGRRTHSSAVVEAVDPTTFSVDLANGPKGATHLDDYTPQVGDSVAWVYNNGAPFIVGRFGSGAHTKTGNSYSRIVAGSS